MPVGVRGEGPRLVLPVVGDEVRPGAEHRRGEVDAAVVHLLHREDRRRRVRERGEERRVRAAELHGDLIVAGGLDGLDGAHLAGPHAHARHLALEAADDVVDGERAAVRERRGGVDREDVGRVVRLLPGGGELRLDLEVLVGRHERLVDQPHDHPRVGGLRGLGVEPVGLARVVVQLHGEGARARERLVGDREEARRGLRLLGAARRRAGRGAGGEDAREAQRDRGAGGRPGAGSLVDQHRGDSFDSGGGPDRGDALRPAAPADGRALDYHGTYINRFTSRR